MPTDDDYLSFTGYPVEGLPAGYTAVDAYYDGLDLDEGPLAESYSWDDDESR